MLATVSTMSTVAPGRALSVLSAAATLIAPGAACTANRVGEAGAMPFTMVIAGYRRHRGAAEGPAPARTRIPAGQNRK